MKANDVESAALRLAVTEGIKDVLKDEALVATFWEAGFKHLTNHATDKTTQWIGKRILTMFVTAAVVAGLIWLGKSKGVG